MVGQIIVLVKGVAVQARRKDFSLTGVVPSVGIGHCFEVSDPSLEAVEVTARVTQGCQQRRGNHDLRWVVGWLIIRVCHLACVLES